MMSTPVGQPFAQARRIVIAANPKSGASSGLARSQELYEALRSDGWQVDITTDLDQMQELVASYHSQSCLRTVVSAGGDGTASAILNRIPFEVPLTIFPMGSENLLSQQYRLPREIDGVCSMLRSMSVKQLDLFRANGQLFLIMVSVGFDAQVVRCVHERRRSHITRWAYRFGILKAIGSYGWPVLRVQILRNERWETIEDCHWLFGFNVPKYAAGIRIMDDAIADDGMIDIGMLKGGNALIGFWNYVTVALGMHRRSRRWRETRASALRINSPQGQGVYQIDGDYGGPLPLEIAYTGTQATLVVPS